MLQYGGSNVQVPTTATAASAASVQGMAMGMGGGMGMGMGGGGMNMGMGVVGGMSMGVMGGGGGGMASYNLHGSTMGSSCESSVERIPVDTIDALGPELAVATSQVLENLSENERKMIIEVLNRDESVRQRDATRMMKRTYRTFGDRNLWLDILRWHGSCPDFEARNP
ncbi:keratin, type I cytoskeletal 13-like [Drosophila takahashii]|uniref:keratin, type I cytoskeletal 13-like n=1 Tax=Drosophila takahashii TaxID=29030 RepID=UPI0038992482